MNTTKSVEEDATKKTRKFKAPDYLREMNILDKI
jgi:hypothetical protein